MLNNLGDLTRIQGDHPGARVLFEEALVIKHERGDRAHIASSLEAIAGALALSDVGRSVSLLGQAARLREETGQPLPPWEQLENERELATARAGIGDAAFDRAWAEGRSLSLDDAVRLALGH